MAAASPARQSRRLQPRRLESRQPLFNYQLSQFLLEAEQLRIAAAAAIALVESIPASGIHLVPN